MTPYSHTCPRCDELSPARARYCPHCGTALTLDAKSREGKLLAQVGRQAKIIQQLQAQIPVNRCPYCGTVCKGASCALCKSLARKDREWAEGQVA